MEPQPDVKRSLQPGDRAMEWRAADLMLDPSIRTIAVIGGPDTGKTTMLETMLAVGRGTSAFVDLDLGQSHVGPPATLAWGYWHTDYSSLEEIVPERIYFVGATSPLVNAAASIGGAATIVSDALDHADKVLVDTSGAINGRFARQLKVGKIRQIRPDIVVGLQRHGELDHILREIQETRLARIVVGTIPSPVKAKTARDRAEYRRARFDAYFATGRVVRLSLREIEVVRFGTQAHPSDPSAEIVQGTIVGLVDRVGRHLAMGLAQRLDPVTGDIDVLSPIESGARVAAIIPGRIRLTESGREQPLRR